jgi:hypothetical protein
MNLELYESILTDVTAGIEDQEQDNLGSGVPRVYATGQGQEGRRQYWLLSSSTWTSRRPLPRLAADDWRSPSR